MNYEKKPEEAKQAAGEKTQRERQREGETKRRRD